MKFIFYPKNFSKTATNLSLIFFFVFFKLSTRQNTLKKKISNKFCFFEFILGNRKLKIYNFKTSSQ